MQDKSVLLLGIGNVLWADEGFGVRCIEALHQHYTFPSHVTLMDGGTQGIYLVQHVQAADILVVFDAIDYGLEGGTLKIIEDNDVPSFMGAKKMSLHQTGFQEVLATTQLLDSYPEKILLIGVQPVELEDYGGSLRPAVKAQIQPAIQIAMESLLNRVLLLTCLVLLLFYYHPTLLFNGSTYYEYFWSTNTQNIAWWQADDIRAPLLSLLILGLYSIHMGNLGLSTSFNIITILMGLRFIVLYFQALGGLAATGFGLIISGALLITLAWAWQKYRAQWQRWTQELSL
jgi:hydrogenase maturation protease